MDYLRIMQMIFAGRTYAEITASVNCSRRDISTAKKAIDTHQITAQNLGPNAAVAAQVAEGDVEIHDVANVATSFPGFDTLARGAGFGLE